MKTQEILKLHTLTEAELVEACKDAISAVDSSDKVADFVSSCELGEAINRMRAALSKAERKVNP